MSYIVCSNSTFDNENLVGISSAESFQNHFKSPLEIEPNSEVAVESVKINRKDEFDIVASDEFYVYFGEELTTSVLSGSVTTNGIKVDVVPGTYTRKQLALALQTAINKAPINPAFAGNCSVGLQTDGGLEYDGFTFTYNGRDTVEDLEGEIEPSQVVEANALTIQAFLNNGGANPSYTYTKATDTFLCNTTTPGGVHNGPYFKSLCAGRFQTKPLANCSGIFSVDFNNASQSSWFIGLSRPTTAYYNNSYPEYIADASKMGKPENKGQPFCDYWVSWSSASDTGGLDRLRVYHWGKDNGDRGWNVKEVKYYEDDSNPFYDEDADPHVPINAAKLNASGLKHLIWELNGNELIIYLSQTAAKVTGKTFRLIGTNGAGAGIPEFTFPAMGNVEEYLSPVLALRTAGQSLVINELDVFDLDNYSFPTTKTFRTNVNNLPKSNQLIAGKDYWSQAETSEQGREELRFNELRPATLWWQNVGAPDEYRYKNTNASGIIDYNVVMIVNPELHDKTKNQYKQQLYVIPTGNANPNMGRMLGFSTFSQIKQSVYGTPTGAPWKQTIIKSINAGEFAVSSCFVRVNDLTFSSFNGAKSSRSQILYHIPRFTNDGKQYGELYFNAPEKTYIKLNNTDKMILNNIKIDIVDRNESVVGDLTAATIVCLHIRRAK